MTALHQPRADALSAARKQLQKWPLHPETMNVLTMSPRLGKLVMGQAPGRECCRMTWTSCGVHPCFPGVETGLQGGWLALPGSHLKPWSGPVSGPERL